jgi:MFS family permease
MPVLLTVLALSAAGLVRGALQATRDLMVFSLTPEGEHGKVFAFVSSGASIGGALTPLAFGWALDNSDPRLVFWLSALLTLLGVATFAGVKRAGGAAPRA